MSTTLGLDLGTNSIGWALIEDGRRIIKSGVRIFPVGVQEDDFLKNGKELSKNIGRRMARSARRRRFRFKLRREKLIELLKSNHMLPENDDFLDTKALYALRAKGLDSKLSLEELGRVFLMLNKRRGFKSNRKAAENPEKKKEEGIVKEGILKLQRQMDAEKSRTVGEYFYRLFEVTEKERNWPSEDTPIEKIRGRFVGREMYEKEFDLLWTKQSAYYPAILTDGLKTKIGAETIYYQRHIKSQKGLVGKCRFEPKKRCAARSSMEFQEYRIWQQLWMVRFASGDRIGEELTAEEKGKVCSVLMKSKKMTEAKLKTHLGIPRNIHFNDVFDLRGNRTSADLLEALGGKAFGALTEAQRFEFWHILSYSDNTEKLKQIVRKKIAGGILPALTEEQIDRYSEINLEEGFCNLSGKALNNILPFLRQGLGVTEATIKAGYNPTRKVVNGKSEVLNKIPPLSPNELRNPIVQQILSETFRLINAVIKQFGKPDMVRIELARELKKPKTKREEARNKAIRKRALREDYAEFLTKELGHRVEPNSPEIRKYELWLEMGCEDQSLDDLKTFMRDNRVTDSVKYKLWKECGRISPYSGKVISLSKLFSPEIQIEHILPYSQTMNNEFGNLSLCEDDINSQKGKRLPYEYFDSIGKLDEFKRNVARLQNEAKRKRFLAREIPEGFLNSQLNNTSYAARDLAWRLSAVFPPIKKEEVESPRVQVVNGQATSDLRRLWALNSILSKDIDTKNRGDHRHHAIDAITIACTTPAIMHLLSNSSKFNLRGQLTNDNIKEPWFGFRNDCYDSVNSIIVSYRAQKRLVGKKPNKTATRDLSKYPDKFIRQSATTIRGSMHEETFYGTIQLKNERHFVTRWSLAKFTTAKQLDKVVDLKVREILKERVKKYGTVKKAFEPNEKDPVLMYSLKGKKIPINSVRVINPGEHLEEIRSGTFVEIGNNYAIAIYQDPATGSRAFETVSFFTAVQRSLHDQRPIKDRLNGKPLLFALKQRDVVVRYDNHADEIEWDNVDYLRSRLFKVRKFDVNGTIYLDSLYSSIIDDRKDRNIPFFQVRPNTLNCVKVDVDILGEITRKWDNA